MSSSPQTPATTDGAGDTHHRAGQNAAGKGSNRARLLLAAAGLALLLGGGWYYLATSHQESTDDAFTDGRAVTIAPKIAGYVSELAVDDNQFVKSGQVLATIDDRDYQIAANKARASLALAEAELSSARLNARIVRITSPSDRASAEAQRMAAEATLARAEADYRRLRQVDRRATTEQDIDLATANERSARSSLTDAQARARKANLVEESVATADAEVARAESQVAQAKADLGKAELDLSHTRILAPQDGWVTKRAIEKGAYVQPGQSLLAVVSPDVWVTANFKESQLRDMRPGQRVEIEVDAYPQLRLTGTVDTIQMGTGARFSAFPAENATGNYIKIVQRVPVKILITHGLNPKIPLPIGLSVVPTVFEQ
ncbi:MAG: HlyD family secretion protein [Telmatospirillum sp.]|nr:HlyD family secretion protein [Telmatospirillum sp.]